MLRRARESYAAGNAEARRLQADALEQLGYGSENGTWRSFYLTGAHELRHGPVGTPTTADSPDLVAALSLDQLLDSLAIRIDGPRSWHADLTLRLHLGADRPPVTVRLHNGVLTHVRGPDPAAPPARLDLTPDESDLRAVLLGTQSLERLAERGRATLDGDPTVFTELLGRLSAPDPGFANVTP
ncbi:alkyl sulfatase C-terminal domain-containing protein [Kitasatospora sp. DSM 101779]|uniref:alkyl sulfatase C-terminal domain-containing protein n=1 Tax=Kitasatospora sp. DSM 101779 TaxID=2853165 RepID=UPI0021D811B7|nr:alkyl sulfatase C-terminal domain-containing protein [Kitasatospora sp. DSM 101779]